MRLNREASTYLSSAQPSTKWIDQAIRFITGITAPDSKYSHDIGGLAKFSLLQGYSVDGLPDKELERLKPLFELARKALLKALEYRKLKNSCLILTALPVEFRAILRRASAILYVDSMDGFDRAFRPEMDELKSDRVPTWVECVFERNRRTVRAIVVLPEEDASLAAQKAVHKIVDNPKGNFDRVIVLGIAGQMDRYRRVTIGDLVISSGLYVAYRSAEKKSGISFTNRKPISFAHDCSINFRGWKPLMFECEPEKRNPSLYGFKRVEQGLIISGPSVSKSYRYKKRLQDAFPGALAVEMESAGCYWAVKDRGGKVIAIKSPADWSNERKNHLWHPYCADVASAFAVDYMMNIYGSALHRKNR
jgi:nucleoside phosphorylase